MAFCRPKLKKKKYDTRRTLEVEAKGKDLYLQIPQHTKKNLSIHIHLSESKGPTLYSFMLTGASSSGSLPASGASVAG